MTVNDEQKISECMATLEKYYRDEYSDMLSFAAYMLNSHSLAEVAVQETFVTALNNMDKLAASEKPVGWLYNTLKNVIRHIRRDVNRVTSTLISLEDAPETASESFDSDTYLTLIGTEKSEDLSLLTQFYVYGYSLKELAEQYNVSVGTIKMRIKRAKERLRKKL